MLERATDHSGGTAVKTAEYSILSSTSEYTKSLQVIREQPGLHRKHYKSECVGKIN